VEVNTTDTVFWCITVVVIFVEWTILWIFTNRVRRATILLEYGIGVTKGTNIWGVFIFLTFALLVAYFLLGRQGQVFDFNNVSIDCGSLLGVILNPSAKGEEISMFLDSNWQKLLVTIFPFLLLTGPILTYMWDRHSDPFLEVKFKPMVNDPTLLTVLRDTLRYGVQEEALNNACNKVRLGMSFWIDKASKHPEKIEEVIAVLIEINALTKLDFTQASSTLGHAAC